MAKYESPLRCQLAAFRFALTAHGNNLSEASLKEMLEKISQIQDLPVAKGFASGLGSDPPAPPPVGRRLPVVDRAGPVRSSIGAVLCGAAGAGLHRTDLRQGDRAPAHGCAAENELSGSSPVQRRRRRSELRRHRGGTGASLPLSRSGSRLGKVAGLREFSAKENKKTIRFGLPREGDPS